MSENNSTFHVEQNNINDVPRGTKTRTIEYCPLCRGMEFRHVLTAKDHTVTRESFPIVQCTRCGFALTNPQPDPSQLDKYYASQAYISHSETKRGIINRIYHIAQRRNIKNKYTLCDRLAPKGDWADYGSGAGAFVQFASSKGKDVTGFEPNGAARKQAHSKGVQCLPVTDFPNQKKYACITLWHVLEHIPDFNQVTQTLSEYLLPNGILVIAVPNHHSSDAIAYKNKWAAYDVPRHLWHFTEKDILALSKILQITLEKIQPMKMDSYYVSMLSEKNLKKGFILRGIWRGLLSNIQARLSNRPYSSQIYVLRK